MIKNERQYRITKAQAQKFKQTLAHLEANPEARPHMASRLKQAEQDALRSQWESLQSEINDYEALLNGKQKSFRLNSFEELPRTLIKARIAAGLSQRELALRLGLKEQQIQRYEATEYASASMARVSAVIQALDIQVREEVFLNA
ncbi:MAG: helix-turn-helix domain-containing protein [Janthinobacterium lividum]